MQSIIDTREFGEKYNYDGTLGSIATSDKTIFRLWAPLAQTVTLNLYQKGDGDCLGDKPSIAMTKTDSVWEVSLSENLSGTYYTFTVDGNETADPYAHTAGINGKRGMVLDFDSDIVCPANWQGEHEKYKQKYGLKSNTEAVIWEVHVRDFSNRMRSSGHKGKYLAFTEDVKNECGQPAGVAHLVDLGITHVHMLPISEYATVDQTRLDDESYNAFNWGYDPLNHNVPSGVYSENPYDGHARVREVREMVAALHARGIGVILDVVYNHTYDFNAPLGKVFADYYFRKRADGSWSDGSGCGNEIASERHMVRKYIVDSLKFWAENYHIDGFRFDLMGVLDLETMREVERGLHSINPHMIIYGEGWTGGQCALDGEMLALGHNACKPSPEGLRNVAIFSDVIRDAVKGEVFNGTNGGYINGKAWENVEKIKFSVMGGTSGNFHLHIQTQSAAELINYVSAHDNHTLWDKIYISTSGRTFSQRMQMNKMAAAIYFTCQGVPFLCAGEELLRSKPNGNSFDHNSYKSPDNVNNIRWSRLRIGSDCREMADYYKGLIALRKAHPAFRLQSPEDIEKAIKFNDNIGKYEVIAYRLTALGDDIIVVYNPLTDTQLTLPKGKWGQCVDGDRAGDQPFATVSGKVTVRALSVNVFVLVK